MVYYSIELRVLIFVKGYGFLSFAKNMGKIIGHNLSKNLYKNLKKTVNTARNFLIIRNNLLQMHLKLLQKDQFKTHQKQKMIWLAIKLLLKWEKH